MLLGISIASGSEFDYKSNISTEKRDSLPLAILILINRRECRFVDVLFDGVKNDAADNDHAA